MVADWFRMSDWFRISKGGAGEHHRTPVVFRERMDQQDLPISFCGSGPRMGAAFGIALTWSPLSASFLSWGGLVPDQWCWLVAQASCTVFQVFVHGMH